MVFETVAESCNQTCDCTGFFIAGMFVPITIIGIYFLWKWFSSLKFMGK